jgi:hypothetical protein
MKLNQLLNFYGNEIYLCVYVRKSFFIELKEQRSENIKVDDERIA